MLVTEKASFPKKNYTNLSLNPVELCSIRKFSANYSFNLFVSETTSLVSNLPEIPQSLNEFSCTYNSALTLLPLTPRRSMELWSERMPISGAFSRFILPCYDTESRESGRFRVGPSQASAHMSKVHAGTRVENMANLFRIHFVADRRWWHVPLARGQWCIKTCPIKVVFFQGTQNVCSFTS